MRPTDDVLFQCPFVMLWQAESLYFSDEDAARMRQYLLKGGFIWSDDSWGTYAWQNFESEMAKVLPEPQYRFVDLPPTHPMFRTLLRAAEGAADPGHQLLVGQRRRYVGTGRRQRGGARAWRIRLHGRLMVLSTHNTDIADGWEREGVDPRYFRQFSVDSYAVGINVMLYTMTHRLHLFGGTAPHAFRLRREELRPDLAE